MYVYDLYNGSVWLNVLLLYYIFLIKVILLLRNKMLWVCILSNNKIINNVLDVLKMYVKEFY